MSKVNRHRLKFNTTLKPETIGMLREMRSFNRSSSRAIDSAVSYYYQLVKKRRV